MAGVEKKTVNPHATAEQFTRDVETVQAAIGVPLRTYVPIYGGPLVVLALVETCGTLAALLVQDDPTTRPLLLARLTELQLHIATVGQRPQ